MKTKEEVIKDLKKEQDNLEQKYHQLVDRLSGDHLWRKDKQEFQILLTQGDIMQAYSHVLGLRIIFLEQEANDETN